MTPEEIKALTLRELRAQKDALRKAVKAIVDKGDDASPAELASAEAHTDDLDALQAEIEGRPAVKGLADSLTRHNELATKAAPRPGYLGLSEATPKDIKAGLDVGDGRGITTHGESELEKTLKLGPWKSLGHFAYEVRRGGGEAGLRYDGDGALAVWNRAVKGMDHAVKSLDPAAKAIDGMSEQTSADGAVFVPLDLSSRIWERVMQDQTNLMSLCDVTPVSGNTLRMPAYNDKDRSSGLYGAQAYWNNEGGQYTGTKLQSRNINWRLNKLTVLMYVTEELAEDVPALDARLNRVAAANIAYQLNKVIIRGDGVGQPQGLLNVGAGSGQGCRIVQGAVSGQGAATIIGSNVTSMFSRRAPESESRLVWLYNVSIEPQLDQLSFTSGSNQVVTFMYLQAGGLRGNQKPELKGRPMYEIEHCSVLGTEGDLILWDPMSYGMIVKTSGVRQQVSLHFKFDTGEQAYKWYLRVDGRPFWDDVLTPPQSGNTRSPLITLNSTRT